MRLVCMADTHLFHDELVVPDGDVLVHAGDMTRTGDVEELTRVRDFLASLPHEHKIVVAGNHDWLFQSEPERARALFAGFTYLEDSGVTIDGVRFWGSPWQPAFHSWAFNLPRGRALAEKWALIADDTDVLVTHGPPHGILDDADGYRGLKDPAGCEELLARVKSVRPKLHVFGHIHLNQGVVDREGTRFVNCTTDECERAPLVVEFPVASAG